MGNVTEEKWIEMLEKKSDGNYIVKYPKVKSRVGLRLRDIWQKRRTHIM